MGKSRQVTLTVYSRWKITQLDIYKVFSEPLDLSQFCLYETESRRKPNMNVIKFSADPDRAWDLIKNKQTVRIVQPVNSDSPKPEGHSRFVFISDTHNRTSRMDPLPEGDVLIHAGDFTMAGRPEEVVKFNEYLGSLTHTHKIVIAGNHDVTFDEENYPSLWRFFGLTEHDPEVVKKCLTNCVYLQDEEIMVEGFRIFGSPWVPQFYNWAFMLPRGDPLREKWNKIPEGIDILVTHGPPLGYGDLATMYHPTRAGCVDLLNTVQNRVKPKYHVFGHIHEGYGMTTDGVTTFVNAAICTKRYQPTNKPIVVDIPNNDCS